MDVEPMDIGTEPDDPERHEAVLAALMRRFLNPRDASFARTLSPANLDTVRVDLIIDGRLPLTKEEIAAVAVENNRAIQPTV